MHHRKPNRLPGYDYTRPGFYFVTICTKNRRHFFGGIHNGVMCINRLGSIAHRQWEWLEMQYDYVRTHTFVVMPNHVHGILEIGEPTNIMNATSVGTGRDLSLPRHTYKDVHHTSDENHAATFVTDHGDRPPQKIKSLSELIGAYKMTTSKIIHQIPFQSFSWQRSFYDVITKNQRAFNNIQKYIVMNPAMWNRDRNNIF